MDCPICFEVLSEQTGFVQMSCKHRFHFACLGAWFSSQFVNKQPESCPCCRHEALEKEALPKRDETAPNRSFRDLQWEEEFIPIPEEDEGFHLTVPEDDLIQVLVELVGR